MGSKEGEPAAPFVGRGYAVAAINYRLSQHAIFPAQIEDCKAAVRWLRAHAAQYGYDPARVAAFGQSAGGHLAAMLGTTGDVRAFDVGAHLDVSSRVQAVVDFFGPTDFLQMDAHRVSAQAMVHDTPDSPESQLVGGPDPRQPGEGRAGESRHLRHARRPAVPDRARRRRPAGAAPPEPAARRRTAQGRRPIEVRDDPRRAAWRRTTAEGLPIALDFLDARFAPTSAAADWLHAARFGVFMHVLPPDAKGLEGVRAFDVEALASSARVGRREVPRPHARPELGLLQRAERRLRPDRRATARANGARRATCRSRSRLRCGRKASG